MFARRTINFLYESDNYMFIAQPQLRRFKFSSDLAGRIYDN